MPPLPFHVLSSLSSGCVTTSSSVVCVEQSAVKQAAVAFYSET